jgi:predicted Zn finger-like uncharacterized protein
MLFTRCPDCDTTFRVTDDALKRANGQVRCGRCASVFNAYAERREEPADAIGNAPSARAIAAPPAKQINPGAAAQQPAIETRPSTAPALQPPATQQPGAAPQPASTPQPPTAAQPSFAEAVAPVEPAAPNPAIRLVTSSPAGPEQRTPAPEQDADPLGGLSVEAVVAQLELETEGTRADAGELGAMPDEAMPPAQVEAVLETEPVGDWRHALKDIPLRSAWWSAGVAFGVVVLALQMINHYRAELVKQPSVGSLVQSAYLALGIVVLPRWDVRQYQILDWVATAEPSSGGIGSLRITARIKNLGPEYQPYPDVNLRLKDRWEAAVGGRVFAPAEYLAAAPRKLMAPGETARAQLELVDPGPDAYGFDLDVCVEVETHVLSCRNDKVFL